MRQTLKKSEILRGRIKFQDIFKRGRPVDGKFVRCLVLREPPGGHPGLLAGVAVARAVRRAVDRNRIKRLLRESFRLNKPLLGGVDAALTLLFLWRSAKQPMPSFNEIDNDMKSMLRRIREGAPS